VITHIVRPPDGRTLAVNEQGDPAGLPVFVHHGTPSSGLLYEPWVRHAAANGIRLIGVDRAGYGDSSRHAGRNVGAVAADVESIADALDVSGHGLKDDADGWIDDDIAFAAHWGFDVGDIDRPTLIVQGGDDRFVPRSHGEWLAAHVRGAEVWIDDADGHLTLLENRVADVHEWLLANS